MKFYSEFGGHLCGLLSVDWLVLDALSCYEYDFDLEQSLLEIPFTLQVK